MANPASYRPRPGEIPDSPGVYRFRDPHHRVIYVGKAKSLRSRLGSYFQDLSALHPRTQQMVTTASSVEWTVVGTEVEALALEYSWIKEYDPRFNVKYRDDKSYPYLAVTLGDEVPRVQVMRGAKRPGTRYFGPYAHAWAIRETVDLLLRVFPVRTCSAGVYKRAGQTGRPCLLGYIDKCSAPCVSRITLDDHRALAEDFCDFMAGDTAKFVRRLERKMQEASSALEFELAARLRDDIGALQRATEKNAVVLSDGTDADVFALVGDELEAAVQVFHVRGGRIRGQRGWIVEKVEDITDAELVEHLLQQVYGEAEVTTPEPARVSAGAVRPERAAAGTTAVPREVLVPVLPPDPEQVGDWLSGLRGSRVQVRVPQRGDKKDLAATVRRNAEQALVLHRTKRAGDLTTRSVALREIQEALDLPTAPLRIECYDVSTTQGTHQVASMVVFEDGLARKSEYRSFVIRGEDGQGARDDTAAMHEVITRRFRRYLDDQARAGAVGQDDVAAHPDPAAPRPAVGGEVGPEAGRPGRFAYPPNLVVVDGGPPQVAAAARALAELGIDDVALCGLAKRLEEVWLPGEDYPVVLQRSSEGLYLLQRVRDEAHRFAIRHHRTRRSKGMTVSALDTVPGLGPARRAALLKHFGSVARLRAATEEEVAAVKGMGPRTARAVLEALNGGAPAGARGRDAPRPDRGRPAPRPAVRGVRAGPWHAGGMSQEPPPVTVPTGVPALEAETPAPPVHRAELLVITGMSGAGRTRAAAVLEDLDWYVVDNLPAQLLTQLAGMMSSGPGGVHRLAAVVDVRGRELSADLVGVLDALREANLTHRVMFLDASDPVLVQRFEAVRRPHPLQGQGTVLDGIAEERALLRGVRERADVVIDTSELNVHDLAREVREAVATGAEDALRINVLSFGFKYGLPLDADHVVDMRFLANPYWITELRHLTGRDEPVRDYVLGLPGATQFIERYVEALEPVLAGYAHEDKRFATIGVGCTGGKHRSVALSEALASALRERGHRVVVSHRDLGRE